MMATWQSSIETSMYWPSPERSRSRSAAWTAMAAKSAAVMSPMLAPGRTGPPPASPVMLSMPPMPCTMMSSAGRCAYGPVWPNPETEHTTSRGLRARSVSWSSPSFSIVPGRKFSMRTSERSASRSSSSLPSGLARSMAMLRLPRLMLMK